MKVLIRGTGTIGAPLIRLMIEMRKDLGIEELMFHKYSPLRDSLGMLTDYISWGAKLAVDADRSSEFKALLAINGLSASYTFEEAVGRADVIIDCTDKGIPRKTKPFYESFGDRKLFIAQGSEKGFGKPYAFDINDDALDAGTDRFLQVQSCNEHLTLNVLKTLVFDPENTGDISRWQFGDLDFARFYYARRDGDISQKDGVIGPEVGESKHPLYGTHHALGVANVLATITDHKFNIRSAADVFNNPFMHIVYFLIFLKKPVTREEVVRRIYANPLAARTYLMTNNQVFSGGRERGGPGSRILNQAVYCIPSINVYSGGREIEGRGLTPQDANALLSAAAAMQWFKDPKTYRAKMRELFFKRPYLFDEV